MTPRRKICTLNVSSDIFYDGNNFWVELSVGVFGDDDIPEDLKSHMSNCAMSQTIKGLQEILKDGPKAKEVLH